MMPILQVVIPANVGAWILGAFLTGIVTLIAYELSHREWITLMAALVSAILCVFVGFLPAWVIAIVVIGAVIYLAYEQTGKW